MSANQRNYEAYLKYFPEKERRALEQAEFVEEEIEEPAIDTVRQINRSKKADSIF